MKYLFNILVCLLLFLFDVKANDNPIYFNPGIKLGYQFGKNGGFIYGFEVSLTTYGPNGGLVGFVSNIDFCKGNTKLHFGLQASTLVGIEIGPTVYFEDKNIYYGITTAAFGYIFILPYYEFSYIFDKDITINQLGIFGKLPIPIKKGQGVVVNIWDWKEPIVAFILRHLLLVGSGI